MALKLFKALNNLLKKREVLEMGKRRKIEYSDITGQRFGKLVAIKPTRTEDYRPMIRNMVNKWSKWILQCDCGNEIKLVWGDINRIKSCGKCVKRKTVDRIPIIVGKVYGVFTVLSTKRLRWGETTSQIWRCRCKCGKIQEMQSHRILHAKKKSCKYCHRSPALKKLQYDFQGKQFGKVTVLFQPPVQSDHRDSIWVCRCSCGNIFTDKSRNISKLVSCNKCKNPDDYIKLDIKQMGF